LKIIKYTVVYLLILYCFTIDINAFDGELIKIPDAVSEKLPEGIEDKISNHNGNLMINFGEIADIISSTVFNVLGNIKSECFSLIGIIILSSLIGALKNAFDNAVFSKISGYISTLCIAVTLFNITIRLWDNIRSVLTEMNVMVTAMLPVMAGLYSAGGNTAAAAVSNSGMMVFIAVVEWICTKGLYPFLQICFVLSFIGCISDDSNTTGLTAYFKNFFTTALVFIMTVFSIILGYQNKIALGADTAAMKTVRYAAGSFIPVVGSAVGEASRAVAGSITMLRSSVGGVAIAALIILVLPPIINLFIHKFYFGFAKIFSQTIGCSRESVLIGEISKILDLGIAVTVSSSLLFIFGFTLLIGSATAI